MMRRWANGRTWTSLAIVAAISLISQSALAQRAIRPVDMQCTGSVKEIGRFLHVVTDKDEAWNFEWSQSIIPSEDIHITGQADREWLQVGMMVRLTGKINTKKATFIDPISALEVISPRPENEPGLTDENPEKPSDGLFEGKEAKTQKKTKPGKLPEEVTATIIGEIGYLKSGKIKIKVPGFKIVQGELAEKCKVAVDVAEPSMIRKGDKVTIKGEYIEGNGPNGAAAGIGAIKKIDVVSDAKFEPMKPLKRGQKPYDNGNKGDGKPGDEAKDGKPEEKTPPGKPDAAKPAGGKGEKEEKPPVEPKKKP